MEDIVLAGVRGAGEWPEGVKEFAVVMTGLPPQCVMEALVLTEAPPRGIDQLLRLGSDYAVPNVSRTARHIIYDGWTGA